MYCVIKMSSLTRAMPTFASTEGPCSTVHGIGVVEAVHGHVVSAEVFGQQRFRQGEEVIHKHDS